MIHMRPQILFCVLVSYLFICTMAIFVKSPMVKNFFQSGTISEKKVVEIVFLSFVQGVTEWFPISSTGHLVIAQELFKINVSVAFDIILHTGTLIGVILFLRKDLQSILRAALRLEFSGREGRMLIYVILGTIPIGLAGFFLKSVFESMFESLFATGVAMLLNGFILYLTRHAKPVKKLDALDSFLIGVSQAVAITPGISRTGITVSTALLRGVENDEAYRFSLLLSIPSIIGGSLIKLQDVSFKQESSMIALGILLTAVIGYFALRIVGKYVIKQSFHKFAYYCLAVGALILLLSTPKNF